MSSFGQQLSRPRREEVAHEQDRPGTGRLSEPACQSPSSRSTSAGPKLRLASTIALPIPMPDWVLNANSASLSARPLALDVLDGPPRRKARRQQFQCGVNKFGLLHNHDASLQAT